MWVTKLLISPVKKRIFCPKTTKFGPKLAFLVNLGQAMQAYSVPCWWVGWWLWRAGCISQDTYLLYNIIIFHNILFAKSGLIISERTFSQNPASFLSISLSGLPGFSLRSHHISHKNTRGRHTPQNTCKKHIIQTKFTQSELKHKNLTRYHTRTQEAGTNKPQSRNTKISTQHNTTKKY